MWLFWPLRCGRMLRFDYKTRSLVCDCGYSRKLPPHPPAIKVPFKVLR
jgi:hypothetical protein